MKNAIILSITILVCLAIGFFIGRFTVNEKIVTRLEKGETISGAISTDQLIPVKEERPEKLLLPMKSTAHDKVSAPEVDTAAIIAEYELKRSYNLVAFDNSKLGKLELFPIIQYNRLSGMDYKFDPVIEKQIIYREKVFQPFVSGSYSTLNYVNIGGGVFYHNLGIEYQYQKSLGNQSNGHLIGLKYKF